MLNNNFINFSSDNLEKEAKIQTKQNSILVSKES